MYFCDIDWIVLFEVLECLLNDRLDMMMGMIVLLEGEEILGWMEFVMDREI